MVSTAGQLAADASDQLVRRLGGSLSGRLARWRQVPLVMVP